MYRDIINLNPGQIVNDFSVTVRIEESSNIVALKVPALKLSEESNVDSKLHHCLNKLQNILFTHILHTEVLTLI